MSAFSVPFLSPAYGGRKSNIVVGGQLPAQVFRLRRKMATEQKEIASEQKIKFGAIRGSRAANHDLCKTGAA